MPLPVPAPLPPRAFDGRRAAALLAVAGSLMLGACAGSPPKPPAPPPPAPAPAPAPAPPAPPPAAAVRPVEAEPFAPALQPALTFTQMTQGPVAAALLYADKLRSLGGNEAAAEVQRLGDPGDDPFHQMQVALALAQTRNPPDLARALGILQKLGSNNAPDAQPLQPLARLLAFRVVEQRRVEDDRDKQAQQVRDSQKRIEQLTERLEALRAIERSFARPQNAPAPAPAAPARATP